MMPAGTAQRDVGLLEREAHLRDLEAVLARAALGQGGLAVVEGAPGAGKSALVVEACRGADALGLRILRARGGELEREYAFGVVRQLFEPVLGTATPARRKRLLAGTAAPAEWLLSAELEAGSERASAGFAVLNAIYWLAGNLAAELPLVLVVDDVHWADESSLRALNFLAARVADMPIALLVALRPVEPGAPAELLDQLLSYQAGPAHMRLGPL